jgi:hypothetical protein
LLVRDKNRPVQCRNNITVRFWECRRWVEAKSIREFETDSCMLEWSRNPHILTGRKVKVDVTYYPLLLVQFLEETCNLQGKLREK